MITRNALENTNTINGDIKTDNEEVKKVSFVRDIMRPYAMKLHTKDQAPREGQQKASSTPVAQWQPTRSGYLQFLIDSLAVYEALDEIVSTYPELKVFEHTGLERAEALKEDIAWIGSYDPSLSSMTSASCGASGLAYAAHLKTLAKESIPKFVCHYYNQYFAHTAGGVAIGKRMCASLLEGRGLKFYSWDGEGVEGVKVKFMLEDTKAKIDALAAQWTDEEKQACLEETAACFRYGGSLMVYMKPPSAGHH